MAFSFGRRAVRALPFICVLAGSTACAMIAGVDDAPKPVAQTALPPRDERPPPPPDSDNGPLATDPFTVEPAGNVGLDFGKVACGLEQMQAVLVTNKLDKEVPIVAALPSGTAATFSDGSTELTGTIPPRGVKNIAVRVVPTTAGASVIPLALTVDGALARIPVKVDGRGAVLRVTPSVADFGKVRYQAGASIQVDVENTGNEHASVTNIVTLLTATDGFDVLPRTAEIGPGGTATFTASLGAAGGATPKATREVTLVTKVGVCESAPKLMLEGERITTDVTVSPATLDWGKKGCGATITKKAITIENFDAVTAASWSVVLPQNTRFEVVGGVLSGAVPPAAAGKTQAVIEFQPKAYAPPLGSFSEDVTIKLTGPVGASDRLVRLNANVRGVIYTVTPTLIDTFSGEVGAAAQVKSARIRNTGNEPASPKYTLENIAGGAFSVEPDDFTLYPNFIDDIDVSFVANEAGNHEGRVTTTRKYPGNTWPLCSADVLVVKGVGTAPPPPP